MARRVFEIAKELGIQSKAIVAKCHEEGIPEDIIKNHMSTVSVGLEATIKEWFSDSADVSGGTAVETAAKVDVDKVRARPARRKARPLSGRSEDDDEADGSSSVATVTAEPKPKSGQHGPAPSDDDEAEPEVEARTESVELAPARVERPAAKSAPEEEEPLEGEGGQQQVAEQPAPKPSESRPKPTINVPVRPKVVTPAGPRLVQKAPVKLSGPKIVRVEAPEQIEAPRPRRPAGVGRPAPGGRGVDFGPPPSEGADRGRSPRRGPNKRRGDAGPSEGDQSRRRTGAGSGGGRAGLADRDWVGPGKFSEADLAEREARLQRAGGYLKARRQQLRRQQSGERPVPGSKASGKVAIAAPFTIKDLSAATGVKGAEIVKRLFMQGIITTINAGIEPEKAQEVMMDFNIDLEVTQASTAEEVVERAVESRETIDERSRGPVVTILGHVDHGKTSLLDRIRNANVAAGEAGGITQATSAFRVPVRLGESEKFVVFIDTPGHEAFTAMRARGASVTDIVVLVVAADDGVMPQTIESINHSKAAGVPIVVALNKIDKPEATPANIQRILGQLAEHDLNPQEWGGATEVVRTNAVKGDGIQELLEILDLQAEVLELKADFGGPAHGTVIESRVETGRGPVANILVQQGQLKVGDFIVAGRGYGRVRDITDDRGKSIKEAQPPVPVQISGLDELPDAGDRFYVVDSLKKAQEAAEQRRQREREQQLARPKVTLDTMFSQMAEADAKEIRVVVKADVQGSVDVLRHEIEKVTTDEVKVRVLHAAVGGITESDVLLADASSAIIVGFNVIPSGKARTLAESKGVEIRPYRVIYDITDDIRKAAEGLLEPELREEILGHAEVRQVFKITRVGSVAGCYVTDGNVQRDALVRVTRQDVVIEHDRRLEQLKRFKDDAKEVRAGMECGMKIVGYDDIKEGDIIECYRKVEVKRSL
ncbi:MAG: translation initiation factor IF-2 [Phycisphaeraceae bacterium]|nr:translation initiation factor IF-2 [Phycisphaeraceae bacterium]